MRLICDSTDSRCDGSPSSKSKRIFEMRSLPVFDVHVRMLTCWSDSVLATSDSSRARSSAFTSIDATNMPVMSVSHSTSISRSPLPPASDTALAQSARCTDTPRPRVTKPMISSPGTGVQQRDSRTITSSRPSTCTPIAGRSRRAAADAPWWAAALRARARRREAPWRCADATDFADTWFSPIDACSASRSA